MYYSFLGRCSNPRFRSWDSCPHLREPQTDKAQAGPAPGDNGCPPSGPDRGVNRDLLLQSAALGGVALPVGTEKGATFNVASLTLDAPVRENYLVQLRFCCNILTGGLKIRLRFQVTRQERDQSFSVPVSAGILYYRDKTCREADTFTLPAWDSLKRGAARCTYSVLAEVEDMEAEAGEAEGSLLIANPVLIATVSSSN